MPELPLFGNPRLVTQIDINSATQQIQASNEINPDQDGMQLPTYEEYKIDIYLSSAMSIESVTLHPLSNVDSFKIQLHNARGYYLEIKSIIGLKTISGLTNQQANLIRILLLGTTDGTAPTHVSFKIVIQ